MKKIVRNIALSLCVASMGGCAIPEVQQPRATVPVATGTYQVPTVASPQNTSVIKTATQPRYLDVGIEQDDTITEEDIEVTLPSMVYVNDRIFEYGRKLDNWKELDSKSVGMELNEDDAAKMVRCFRRLQNVLNGYSDLRSKMLQAQQLSTAEQISGADLFQLQTADIEFLEDGCGKLVSGVEDQSAGWNKREEGADLSKLETLIDRYDESREYEEVIQVWLQIPPFQISRVHVRSKVKYGNALMYLHQEEKATEVYREVVDQMSDSDEQATDLVSLRKILADLYTAAGDYKSAKVQYKKISEDYQNLGRLEEWSKLQLSILDRSLDDSPELTQYSSMIRNYLGFIPEQDGYKIVWQADKFLSNYPYSPVASNVDFIRESAMLRADLWFNSFIGTVDALSSEKKFDEALELLETIPTDIIDADKQLQVRGKNEELLLAAAVEKETDKMALIQELQHQWNNGMLLVKAGRYDEAIDVFTNLLDSEYGVKAENKINEISLQAAKADRKKAAGLFIRFTKTTDPESRKTLLIESRQLLRDILVKYPDAEITSKVKGNIARVEQEMNLIDPNLINFADQDTQEIVVDGVGNAFKSTFIAPEPVGPPVIETSTDESR
ncbi:MAG: tetratricopeptide (TPR) repeat protein [Desulforhopalus sp.]|jgi:tetratricopeptide (TPR) repeat protein